MINMVWRLRGKVEVLISKIIHTTSFFRDTIMRILKAEDPVCRLRRLYKTRYAEHMAMCQEAC